jgi:hypothetical protein
MTPQPFYTSKAFWVAFLTLVGALLVKLGVVEATFDTVLWSGMVLGLLSAIFRWNADQPLSLGEGKRMDKSALRGGVPGHESLGSRLTKD